jgi:hypothetical protein
VERLDDALSELTGDVVDHHKFAVHPPHATRRRSAACAAVPPDRRVARVDLL